jgi:hypothetical protein
MAQHRRVSIPLREMPVKHISGVSNTGPAAGAVMEVTDDWMDTNQKTTSNTEQRETDIRFLLPVIPPAMPGGITQIKGNHLWLLAIGACPKSIHKVGTTSQCADPRGPGFWRILRPSTSHL